MIELSDIIGFTELASTVRRLMYSPVATREVRKGVIAALRPIGKAHKAVVATSAGRTRRIPAYTGNRVRIPGGTLKRATGTPVFSRGTGRRVSQQIAQAKVGLNTGKKGAARAFHAAMWSVGTDARWTGRTRKPRRGPPRGKLTGRPTAFRGKVHPNHKIRAATLSAVPQAMASLTASLASSLDKIVLAARKA